METRGKRNYGSNSTLNGRFTSVNTHSLFTTAWSATLGSGVFVILPVGHKLLALLSSPTVSDAFLSISGRIKYPIVFTTSLYFQGSCCCYSIWILERCSAGRTKFFLVLILPEFPSEVSCSYLFSPKWSCFPTPSILTLIWGLSNSQAQKNVPETALEFHSGYADLEASPLRFLVIKWCGTKFRNAPMFVTLWSVQPPSTSMHAVFHWVRADPHSLSGVGNVRPIATDSCLPPSLCLFHILPRWCIHSSLAMLCCLLLLAVLGKRCKDCTHTAASSKGPSLKLRFTACATEPLFPFCLCSALSWKICSPFVNSVQIAALFKPLLPLWCRHLVHSRVPSAWVLLSQSIVASLPVSSTHCLVSLRWLQLLSHTHSSAICDSSSHHCLNHWLLVRPQWVASLSQVLIHGDPWS